MLILRMKKSVYDAFIKSVGRKDRSKLVRTPKTIIRNGKTINTFVWTNPDKNKKITITRKNLTDKYLKEKLKNTKNTYQVEVLEVLLKEPLEKRKEFIKEVSKYYLKKGTDETGVVALMMLNFIDIKDSFIKTRLELKEKNLEKLGEKIFEIKKYLDEQGIKYKATSSEDGYAGNSYYITPLDENGNNYKLNRNTVLTFRISDHEYTAHWRRDESMVNSVNRVKKLIEEAKEYKKIEEEENKKRAEELKNRELENIKLWEDLKKQYPNRDWYLEEGEFRGFSEKMKNQLKDTVVLFIPNGEYSHLKNNSILYGVESGSEKRRNNSYLIPEEKLAKELNIIGANVEYVE